MEENNITNQTNEEKKTKPTPTATKKKDNDKDSFADYKAEFKKIIWPSPTDLVKRTATVIVTSLIVGVIIFCMDTVFSAGYSAIIGLLG